MKKRIRQYIGLLSSVLAYYAVHEGAHLIYALSTGVFRQINFMGIGMQIGIYEEQMSDRDYHVYIGRYLGAFNLLGWKVGEKHYRLKGALSK